jgi:hypothetical protein
VPGCCWSKLLLQVQFAELQVTFLYILKSCYCRILCLRSRLGYWSPRCSNMASSSSDELFRFAICLGAPWSSRTGDLPTKFEMNWRSSTSIPDASSPSEAETSCRRSCSILIPRGSTISYTSSRTGAAAVDDSPAAELAAATNAPLLLHDIFIEDKLCHGTKSNRSVHHSGFSSI